MLNLYVTYQINKSFMCLWFSRVPFITPKVNIIFFIFTNKPLLYELFLCFINFVYYYVQFICLFKWVRKIIRHFNLALFKIVFDIFEIFKFLRILWKTSFLFFVYYLNFWVVAIIIIFSSRVQPRLWYLPGFLKIRKSRRVIQRLL